MIYVGIELYMAFDSPGDNVAHFAHLGGAFFGFLLIRYWAKHPDAAGRYSWWSYRFHAREKNVGWRIDYFLVSSRLASRLKSAEIHDDIMGSDHCPVSLELE
jgi:exonuclease III